MKRLWITAIIVLTIPAFATAQRHGGAPMAASRPAPVISHAASAPVSGGVRAQSGMRSGRVGTSVGRTQNGGRIANRGNRSSSAFNGRDSSAFNGTDFQNVPGLGFDFPHLAAVGGNRHGRGNRFDGESPFGFSGFLLNPPVFVDGAQDAGVDAPTSDQEAADDPPEDPLPPRRSRSSRAVTEAQPDSAPAAPLPDPEQYVFVRRDGSLVFAVGYTWDNGTLRYVTPDGLRRSIGRDALDLKATQQFNEQRGLNFNAPA